ncbi:MAG: type VI secretion protein [Alphaproteobacteria bacterium]|nr:type VI secretion protein [Alphaproteobacteria bacterium]
MFADAFPIRPGKPVFSRSGRLKRGFGLGLALAVGASAAGAQDPDAVAAPATDYVAALKACRSISEPTERLACFDRTAGAMVAATESGEVSIVDREDVRKTRRSLFGFTMPEGGILGSSDTEDDTSMLESTITDVRRLGGDTYVIAIAEGSKWQMSNVPMRLRPPRVGDEVVFKKAALGSYFIRIAGQTGVKGRRIE